MNDHQMTVQWLSNDSLMTVQWLSEWMSDDCPMTVQWLSNDKWLSNNWFATGIDFLMNINFCLKWCNQYIFHFQKCQCSNGSFPGFSYASNNQIYPCFNWLTCNWKVQEENCVSDMLCHYLYWDFDTSNLFIFEQGQWTNFELFLDWICTIASHYFDVHSICFWIGNYSFYATGELIYSTI